MERGFNAAFQALGYKLVLDTLHGARQCPAMLSFILPFPEIDSEIIRIGPVALRWYSLAYIAGIALAWVYMRRLMEHAPLWQNHKKGKPPFDKVLLEDFIFWGAIGVILGGRIGYILFYGIPYQSDHYLAHPLEILKVWKGGMSFHGGFLGVVVATIAFCRKHSIDTFLLADILAGAAPIGLLFGRLANFINGELWGRVSEAPWAMVFPTGGPLARHPSQLYEALLEGVLIFLVIRIATFRFKALDRRGVLTGIFFTGYGIARIFVEFFRDSDTRPFGPDHWLTQGMLLSSVMVLIGGWFFYQAFGQGGQYAAPASSSKASDKGKTKS